MYVCGVYVHMCVGVYVCFWGVQYVHMCLGVYVGVWGLMYVCEDVCTKGCGDVCMGVYVWCVCVRHTWVKGNRERERKPVVRKELKSTKVGARKN